MAVGTYREWSHCYHSSGCGALFKIGFWASEVLEGAKELSKYN